MLKPNYKINNWSFRHNYAGVVQLVGDVYGHRKVSPFGTARVVTSLVLSIDVDKGFAETLNSRYRLGNMDERFKEATLTTLNDIAKDAKHYGTTDTEIPTAD